MKKVKNTLSVVASVVVFVVLWFGIQHLVMPKYMDDIPEGNFTEEYYKETTNHDVIMVGDCEVYENFSPITLWEEYGITSYIRGNAQQLVWQSYYMLEDTLKYETPKVVIYNVQSLMHDSPQREEYNRMTLDGMKWSATKVKAVKASMLEEESFYDYLFPILRYHSRITDLTQSDFKYYFSKEKVAHNGYYMRVDTTEDNFKSDQGVFAEDLEDSGEDNVDTDVSDTTGQTIEKNADDFMDFDDFDDIEDFDDDIEDSDDDFDEDWDDDFEGADDLDVTGQTIEKDADDFMDFDDFDDIEEFDEDLENTDNIEDYMQDAGNHMKEDNTSPDDPKYQFGSYPMKYLDKLRELCEEKGITLILVKAPSSEPVWYNAYEMQVEEYAKKHQLTYINYLEKMDELGMDYRTDSYDNGLHMNLYGAEKLARDLGKTLAEEFHIPDHRGEEPYEKVYAKKVKFYDDMISRQKEELEEYGRIINY